MHYERASADHPRNPGFLPVDGFADAFTGLIPAMNARDADRGARRTMADIDARAAAWTARRDDRARRQSELLDEALKETFPASDPVSVALVE